MHLVKPFDPISAGEQDNFVFDFTNEVGPATIASTSWSCVVRTPPPGGAIDPAPQAHVIGVFVQSVIVTEDPSAFPEPPPATALLTGAFSVAQIGGFASPAAGATYTMEATVVTSDGRTLSLSADLPISRF